MCCRSGFNSFSARLPCYLSKGLLKRDFLDSYLTTFFALLQFENTSAKRVIFFLKIFRVESKFRKCKKKKIEKNIFNFWDNCIWKCCDKLSLLRTEYLSSAVNGLANSLKILHENLRDFFNLNHLRRDQEIR